VWISQIPNDSNDSENINHFKLECPGFENSNCLPVSMCLCVFPCCYIVSVCLYVCVCVCPCCYIKKKQHRCRSLYVLLTIVLFVLRYTASDYPFVIFKTFLHKFSIYIRLSDWYYSVSMVWVQIPSREEQKFDSSKI